MLSQRTVGRLLIGHVLMIQFRFTWAQLERPSEGINGCFPEPITILTPKA